MLLEKALYPATNSIEEWGNEILALDHLVVEGFLVKGLRPIVTASGGTYAKGWGSLKLLEVVLSAGGHTEEQAKKFLLIRDTPPVGMYVLNMFCMRGSRLWGSRLHRACVV